MKQSIAFVVPCLNAGGAQRVVSSLANLLVDEYQVHIIALYPCEPFYRLDKRIKIATCQDTYLLEPTLLQSIKNNYLLVSNLAKNLKKLQIDIAIGFLPATNVYTILACKMAKIPSIISERANPEFNRINKVWHTIRKLVYPYAHCLVVQTEGTKNYFKHYVNSKIQIIKNPNNTELLDKRDANTPKENIILNVGRLIDLKNQDLLIRAFSNIKNTDWKVVLLGDGDNFESYKQLISNLGMQDQILLAGNIKNISEYYNKAKIFAFTSKHEGFPNVIIEAMSYGLACISTDCPYGPSEIIQHNVNGILLPVGDQQALEDNLSKLMNDTKLQTKFSENAKESVEAYSPTEIASQWRKLIHKLITNN